MLFDRLQTTLVEYPDGKVGGYVVPAGVVSIGVSAFLECTNLTSVTIPDTVTNIGSQAFGECSYLSRVTIGNRLATIGDYAFQYCVFLKSLYFTGNAPTTNSDVLTGDMFATVYYSPGTTGWGSTYDGLPAVLWNPQVQNDASFGLLNNQFGFDISGNSNLVVVVEATTNLLNPVWLPVVTNSLTSGSSHFSDVQSANYPGRFYRLSVP